MYLYSHRRCSSSRSAASSLVSSAPRPSVLQAARNPMIRVQAARSAHHQLRDGHLGGALLGVAIASAKPTCRYQIRFVGGASRQKTRRSIGENAEAVSKRQKRPLPAEGVPPWVHRPRKSGYGARAPVRLRCAAADVANTASLTNRLGAWLLRLCQPTRRSRTCR